MSTFRERLKKVEQAHAEQKRRADLFPELLANLEALYSALDSCIELTPELMASTAAVISKAKATGEAGV